MPTVGQSQLTDTQTNMTLKIDHNCQCENEAKVLYDMYKLQGSLSNMDIVTPVCCSDDPARMVISGTTLTLYYADGTVSTYTGA